MKIIKSGVYDRFACLAGACPDSCCKDWEVAVDAISAAHYRKLPGALGDRLRQVLRTEDGITFMTIENGRCPMWRQDGLCQIQGELGHEALCKTCRDFPRLTHDYGDFQELGLELSCPEAARLLLAEASASSVTTEVPGGEAPEYDREAMGILLRTRREALTLLQESTSVGEALALLLLYGYHAQAELDGEPPLPFDRNAALASAREFARPADYQGIFAFFAGLEILTEPWRAWLNAPAGGAWRELHRRLAVYFVERYWLQAVSDYDLVYRVKLAVISCLTVRALGGDPVRASQLYSKEIENSAENVEALLDAAYAHPAFTDDKLLYLLLNA